MSLYKDFVTSLDEASEMSLELLNPTERKDIDKFLSVSKSKYLNTFEGIHGKVTSVLLPMSGHMNKNDVTSLSKTLTAATKIKSFRWVGLESTTNGMNSDLELNIGY